MTFFQHVLFNDRLTELHYEMFWKMTALMNGVTPDKFEVVLMVRQGFKYLMLYVCTTCFLTLHLQFLNV
jgi:chitin synthase